MGGRPSSEASQSPNARKIDAYCRRVLADAARAAIRSASPNRFRSVNVRTVLYQVIGTPTRPHGPYTLFQQLADEVVKGETIREDDARQRPDGRICRTRGCRSWAGVAGLRVVLLALSTNVASSLVPREWRQRGLHREERGNAPGWGSGGGGLGAGCSSDRACAALRGWGKGRLPQSAATANSSRRAK